MIYRAFYAILLAFAVILAVASVVLIGLTLTNWSGDPAMNFLIVIVNILAFLVNVGYTIPTAFTGLRETKPVSRNGVEM